MRDFITELGICEENSGASAGDFFEPHGEVLESVTPIDGAVIARVRKADQDDTERVIATARDAFFRWREVPAPRRGEVIRKLGLLLRDKKQTLGKLVSLEMGKTVAEGEGEVQEMIDICDFAAGLSRQLYGLVIASERPRHRMSEQWHPLGVVGVITAFNFPVAVWAWNTAIAAVCGDSVVWKPSSKTPLCAIAVQKIANQVFADAGHPGVASLVVGDGRSVGDRLLRDRRIPLVSATGSCAVGQRVAEAVGHRFGRTILELGGNNAVLVMDDADLDLAIPAVLFGAVGTSGQRCTSTRRLLLQQKIAGEALDRLVRAYGDVTVGDPLQDGVLMGPLVDQGAVAEMQAALTTIREQGGEVLCGGKVLSGPQYPGGCYVEPTIVRARADMPIVQEETFAPILSVITVDDLEHGIQVHNDVPQGLSSSIFTESMRSAEQFLAAVGSDCGIANVNVGTSGAEIGGAFGGEKDTGGGRESGSDAWKGYMRRQTQTINWSKDLPLAQGIRFG